LNVGMLLCYC